MTDVDDGTIRSLRAFNRFYTTRMGLLGAGLLDSRFTLTQARVLFELATREQTRATAISRILDLDPGYLSRIVKDFAERGLVLREPAPDDARQHVLTLTEAGRAAFAALDAASQAQATSALAAIDAGARRDLAQGIAAIRRTLGDAEPLGPVSLRASVTGDLGWIIHRQALLYQREYGWDGRFEVLLAEIFAQMMQHFDPQTDRGWIAESDGAVVGSVFVIRQSDTVAKLRLLYVEPRARGQGLGRRLVRNCIDFARGNGFRCLTLWTNDVLKPARRIYADAGFVRQSAEPAEQFGQRMLSEIWNLDLTRTDPP